MMPMCLSAVDAVGARSIGRADMNPAGSGPCMMAFGPAANGPSLRIGVVIPCRGDGPLLKTCLESLGQFAAAGDQIVVVDGDADPQTAALAKAHGASYLCSADARRGYVIARGVRHLLQFDTVDILLICHADSTLNSVTRDKLAARVGVRARDCWGFLGHRINDRRFQFRLVEWGNRLRGDLLDLPYGDQAMFVGVHLLKRTGGWPVQPQMEDLELALRLRRVKSATPVDAPVTISSRHWAAGISRATLRNWALAIDYISHWHHCGPVGDRL